MAFDSAAVPRFRRGVKLRFDASRESWVLLAPEKAFMPDAVGAEILKLIDGQRSMETICRALAAQFGAPFDRVSDDVAAMLGDLAAKGAVELCPAE